MSQTNAMPTLPKAEEIERVEINKASAINWYKSDELLRLLSKFVPSSGTYLDKQPFQRGTFVLRNGARINWLANSVVSILLSDGPKEQLFILPKENTPLFKIWDKEGNENFIDVNGNVAWKTWRKSVGEFSEGLVPILIGDKWGYADRAGEIVIQPRWKTPTQGDFPPAGAFSEGMAAVIENVRWDVLYDSNYYTYKCGYINTRGEYVIASKFRQKCGAFSNGLAQIKVDLQGDEYEKEKGWIGFLDKYDNWAIKPLFYEASDFKNGFALVQSEPLPPDLYIKIPETDLVRNNFSRQSLYLVDKIGRKASGKQDCGWRYSFYEGLALKFDESNKAVFINERCEKVFQLPSEIGNDGFFSSGLMLISKDAAGEKLFGYVDRTGKMTIPFQFIEATPFSDGLAGVIVKEKDKTFSAYINPKGEIVLRNKGTDPFHNGLSFRLLKLLTISESQTNRNIYGYMNKQGKYIWLSPGAETTLDKDWVKENYVDSPIN